MADDESIFVDVWTERFSRIAVPHQLVAAGAVRRLDVGGLMGKAMPKSTKEGQQLIDGIVADIGSVLGDEASYWSPAPGLIDIFYAKLVPAAADLKHSVVRKAAERRIRTTLGTGETTKEKRVSAPASIQERRVSWEKFQAICRKAQAKPEHVQTIDVSEMIFGVSDPNARVSRRAWLIVEDIVDDFLEGGGYCTRYPGNLLLFIFPGLSISLAQMKRKAIAGEIERAVAGLGRRGEPDEGPADDARTAGAPTPKAASGETADQSPEEVARLNMAFAAMAGAMRSSGVSEDELTLPQGISVGTTPVWRAGNQTLVGHTIRALPTEPATERDLIDELFASTLDLPVLAHAQGHLLQHVDSQNPHLVIVPVSWHTLERPATRTKYLELAARLPEEMRRYLVISLRDIPDDLMVSRVEDRIFELRRLCRTLMCRAHVERRDFEQFHGLQFHAIGVTLASGDGEERDIIAAMDGFLDAISPLATKSFADGLNSKSLVIAALAAGFDYLSGAAIVDRGAAVGVRSFSIPDLYETDGAGGKERA
jgi:hypothetical protein